MATRSTWLQPGPAKRCARVAVLWAVVAVLAVVMTVVFVDTPVWGRICQALAALAAAVLAGIYYASYRVHARDGI